MSTTATKLRWADAVHQANLFRDLFSGQFIQWHVAGSIRRNRPEVGDIDHVVIPQPLELSNLFGGVTLTNKVRHMADNLIERGTLKLARRPNGNKCNGEKSIAVIYRGVTHEICLCEQFNFGCFLAMKTGSASFSRELVTRLHSRGYRQQDGRLCRVERKPDGLGGYTELVQPLDCSDERIFFGAAGLMLSDWPPEKREGIPR